MDLYKKVASLTDVVPAGRLTVRDYAERKRMILILATIATLFLTALTWFTLGAFGRTIAILVAGGLWGFLIFLSMYGLRCPDCEENLGHTLSGPITPYWAIPDSAEACPTCGCSLDERMMRFQRRRS